MDEEIDACLDRYGGLSDSWTGWQVDRRDTWMNGWTDYPSTQTAQAHTPCLAQGDPKKGACPMPHAMPWRGRDIACLKIPLLMCAPLEICLPEAFMDTFHFLKVQVKKSSFCAVLSSSSFSFFFICVPSPCVQQFPLSPSLANTTPLISVLSQLQPAPRFPHPLVASGQLRALPSLNRTGFLVPLMPYQA